MQKFFFFICVFLRFSANTQKTIKANKRLQQQQFTGQNQESKEPLKEHEQEIIINFPSYDDNCCDIFVLRNFSLFYFRSCLNELQNIPSFSLRNSLLKCNL